MNVTERNGLAVSASKMVLFKAQIRFLGHDVFQGTIKTIVTSLAFTNKFPNVIKDKKQLQRFLGCLNYIYDFFPKLRQLCAPLYRRPRKSSEPWSDIHNDIVRQIKQKVESLQCLGILHPSAFLIVEIDASD